MATPERASSPRRTSPGDLPPEDYGDWTLEDAKRVVAEAVEIGVGRAAYETNRLLIEEDDHWQKGAGWITDLGTGAVKKRNLAKIEPQFTPIDQVGECLDRMAMALLRREADVDFVPREAPEADSDAEDKLRQEAEDLKSTLSAWWDDRRLWELAEDAVKRARWAGRGGLRRFIRPGALTTVAGDGGATRTTLPGFTDLGEALAAVELAAPMPDEALVYRHPETGAKAAVFLFEDEAGQEGAELWFVEDGEVVLRKLGAGSEPEARFTLPTDTLPIAEMEAPLLVTESVRRQQRRLNFFETILVRVGETAGFPERYVTNAEPEGVWLPDASPGEKPLAIDVDSAGKRWYLHATPRTMGSGVTTELIGIPKGGGEDAQLADPEVFFKEPTDPDYAIRAANHARATILWQCKQAHVLISGDATASGRSREQARSDFEDDLAGTKTPLEGMLRDTIEGAIAMAETMLTDSARVLDRFRVVVSLHLKTGPISPEERKQNAEDVAKRLLSRESAMAASGVEDVAAEVQKIEGQPGALLERMDKVAEIIQTLRLAAPEIGLRTAGQLAGLDEERDAELLRLLNAADADRQL